jgi:AraC family transcriptional regulator
LKIEVVRRPPVRVACLSYAGPCGEPLRRFWRATIAPWLADLGLLDCPRYGLPLDDTRYDACVELPPGISLPDVDETTLPGGVYAITHFRGAGAGIGTAWAEFVHECRATHRLDDSRPSFEHYPRGSLHDARTGEFVCELCLPVEDGA